MRTRIARLKAITLFGSGASEQAGISVNSINATLLLCLIGCVANFMYPLHVAGYQKDFPFKLLPMVCW